MPNNNTDDLSWDINRHKDDLSSWDVNNTKSNEDDIGWDTEDEGGAQYAANMYVRLPNSVLLQQSPEHSLSGM